MWNCLKNVRCQNIISPCAHHPQPHVHTIPMCIPSPTPCAHHPLPHVHTIPYPMCTPPSPTPCAHHHPQHSYCCNSPHTSQAHSKSLCLLGFLGILELGLLVINFQPRRQPSSDRHIHGNRRIWRKTSGNPPQTHLSSASPTCTMQYLSSFAPDWFPFQSLQSCRTPSVLRVPSGHQATSDSHLTST